MFINIDPVLYKALLEAAETKGISIKRMIVEHLTATYL